MSFLQASLDFFMGCRSSHLGSYQYAEHSAMRDGKSMSGVKLWAEIEASELNSSISNLMSAEELLAHNVAQDIYDYLPEGTPVLEMGPGTENAFRKKMLRILMALRSIDYICVDTSRAMLDKIVASKALSRFNVRPILDDFFEDGPCYFDEEEHKALICMFGSTIGNMVAPLSEKRPENALINHLSILAQKIHEGWLLITFDANHDGEGIEEYYNHHTLFHLNVFDRMAVELPITGDFDPCAFTYEPLWIPSSGQMAHIAVVLRDMHFELGGRKISLSAGQKLHMKNSFKFSPAFFSNCCERAGVEIVKTWDDPSLTYVYLLKKKTIASSQTLPLLKVANFY